MDLDKKDVYLNISDVASYIGQNKWDYISPFNRLWKRIDKTNYEKCMEVIGENIGEKQEELITVNNKLHDLEAEFAQKKITKRQLTLRSASILKEKEELETQIETITSISDKVKLRPNELVEKHLNSSDLKAIQDLSKSTTEKKETLNKILEERGLKRLQNDVHSYINRTHGTMLEDSAISLFERKMGVTLDVSQKFNKRLLHSDSTSKMNWYICGKVDGLYIDYSDYSKSYVVEVKNRTKSFFSSLRDYEKTQIQLYMWMLGIQQAKLVEKYENKIRITNIMVDTVYIEGILSDLKMFTDILENQFLQFTLEKKKEFVLSNDNQKKTFLSKLYLQPIQQKQQKQIDDLDSESEINCIVEDDDDL